MNGTSEWFQCGRRGAAGADAGRALGCLENGDQRGGDRPAGPARGAVAGAVAGPGWHSMRSEASPGAATAVPGGWTPVAKRLRGGRGRQKRLGQSSLKERVGGWGWVQPRRWRRAPATHGSWWFVHPPPRARGTTPPRKRRPEQGSVPRRGECASGCTWSTARATAPSPGRPTPGVVKQDKSSGGSVDTTKTRSGPQRVRMSSGERPIGAAKGKQPNTEALYQSSPSLT